MRLNHNQQNIYMPSELENEIQLGRSNATKRLVIIEKDSYYDEDNYKHIKGISKNWHSFDCNYSSKYQRLTTKEKEIISKKSKVTGFYFCEEHNYLHLYLYVKWSDTSRKKNKLLKANPFDTFLNISFAQTFFGQSICLTFGGAITACIHIGMNSIPDIESFLSNNLKLSFFDDFGMRTLQFDGTLLQLDPNIKDHISNATVPLMSSIKLEPYIQVHLEDCREPEDILKCSFASTIDTPLFSIDFFDTDALNKLDNKAQDFVKRGLHFIAKVSSGTHDSVNKGTGLSLLFSDAKHKKLWIINCIHDLLKDHNNVIKLIQSLSFETPNDATWSTSILIVINTILNFKDKGLKLSYFNSMGERERVDLTEISIERENLLDFWTNQLTTIPIQLEKWSIPSYLPLSKFDMFPDIHLNKPELLKNNIYSKIMSESSLEEILDTTDKLTQEAVANKAWIIPPKAICEVQIGAFIKLELREEYNTVYFAFVDANDRILHGYVEPFKNNFWLSPNAFSLENTENSIKGPHIINLLVMTFVRDFWVVEEREKTFSEKRTKHSRLKKSQTNKMPRIVYLPRVKYIGSVNPSNLSDGLQLTARQTHRVSEHLRRSDFSSNTQKTLAAMYNYHIPQGYTFVKAHMRGEMKNRDVIYRSRSASNMVSNHLRAENSGQVAWFKFEKDVTSLLNELNFNAHHRGGSGDGGIDIDAEFLGNEKPESWLIQCKAVKRSIGTPDLRDLLGADTVRGGNNKLMFVTTSDYSKDAIALAKEFNIRLINGSEFVKLINSNA